MLNTVRGKNDLTEWGRRHPIMFHTYSMGTGLAIVPTTEVVDHLAERSVAGKLCGQNDLTSPSSYGSDTCP